MLYFGTSAYLFSPDEGSGYIFLARNKCYEFFNLMVFFSKRDSIILGKDIDSVLNTQKYIEVG